MLSDLETGLQLPTDHLVTPGTSSRVDRFAFELPAPAENEAELIAAYLAQLARYSGQNEIPVRVRGSRTFCAAFAVESETPISTVVEAVRGALGSENHGEGRETSDSPAAFTWQRPEEIGGSLKDESLLHLVVTPGSREATFVYRANAFEAATVQRFAGHLCTIVSHVKASPNTAVGLLPLLPSDEARSVRAAGEGSLRPYAMVPLHARIEKHAAETPDKIAVRFRDQTLTYASLNAHANRLAHYLCTRGVAEESRVMVSLEPGLEIAVALLAIHKAGGVYVPLEPTYPAARILTILEDTAPTLVLTSATLLEKLPLAGFPTLELDFEGDALRNLSEANPLLPIARAQTAYVYYTSGTTGKPKGVMASHANLAHYIMTAQERYAFNPQEVMPAIARFSFSISMFELMSPLVAGGTLVVLARDHVIDPARMTESLEGVTFFHMGPSLLRGVLAHIRHHRKDFSRFDHVRHASSGGDMVSPEILEGLKEIFQKAEVFVIYGCSEISCMGVTYPALRDRTITRTYVGRPFDNVVVRVLDSNRNVVPFGVVGEICFAGEGIAKGYLNRPELTKEKFVEIEGKRFYCTGDMGRVGVDGNLEILGRRDFQVQLRGMRIELGEIEYTLRKAPRVKDGVAMARPDGHGDLHLVGYVVYEGAPDPSAVRKYMFDHLPDYMVPSLFVALEKLPLNHNMKIDRHALPAPSAADQRPLGRTVLHAPETETETALAETWKKLLNVAEIDLEDNFFELGGHSLLGVRLILDVEQRLGVTLDGMDILRETLETLSASIDRKQGRPAKTRAAAPPRQIVPDACFFFGEKQDLYGVLSGTKSDRALLICAPPGQEQVRAHFVLQKIARQAAVAGIPSLRFDHFGTGNSFGESADATGDRWRSDIRDAYDELKRRTGATKIAVLGLRLGATLAWNAHLDVERWILWDPILLGWAHILEMERVHAEHLRSLQNFRMGRPPKTREGQLELLGLSYSEKTLQDLMQLEIHPSASPSAERDSVLTGLYDCQWTRISCLEDILPDVGIGKAVLEALTVSSFTRVS